MGTGSCREGHSRNSGSSWVTPDAGLKWLMFTEHLTELHTLKKPKGKENLSVAALGLIV